MPAPNLVLITLHDTGRFFGCYGHPEAPTPHIDAFASRGVRCAEMYAASPVCSPSRGSLMTGRYPQSNGLMGLTHPHFCWALNPGEKHLAQILRESGYRTHLIGLQHESRDARDFEYDEIIPWPEHRPEGRALAADVAAYFDDFLLSSKNNERPFFAQVGLFETHTPYDRGGIAPSDAGGIWRPDYIVDNEAARRHIAGLQGSVQSADAAIGRIVDAIESHGLADNTLVVITVDHGVEIPRGKWHCTRLGLGIAFLCRWPGGGIGGGRTLDQLLSNVDVLPTLLELLGLPPGDSMQGCSFAQALQETTAPPARESIFGMYQVEPRVQRSVFDGTHNLILNFSGDRPLRYPVEIDRPIQRGPDAPPVELYDSRSDPWELNNLADQPESAEIQSDLLARLREHLRSIDDPILRGPIAPPFYWRASSALADSRD